jgi:hypothetical protein
MRTTLKHATLNASVITGDVAATLMQRSDAITAEAPVSQRCPSPVCAVEHQV